MPDQALKNLRVLVTRPAHQQENFIRLLTESGALPVSFPLITISAPKTPEVVKKALLSTDSADFVIFVSPNAVNFAHNLRPLPWRKCSALIGCVGDVTAKTLLHYGSPVNLCPSESYSAEALLELDKLQNLTGKKVVVIQGDKSRKLLGDELVNRGAKMERITVYQNSPPAYNTEQLTTVFLETTPDVICITSNQGILNLTNIMGETYRNRLVNIPLIVNSERCSKLARKLGYKAAIEIADKPGDPGQLEGLKRWYSTSNFNHSE